MLFQHGCQEGSHLSLPKPADDSIPTCTIIERQVVEYCCVKHAAWATEQGLPVTNHISNYVEWHIYSVMAYVHGRMGSIHHVDLETEQSLLACLHARSHLQNVGTEVELLAPALEASGLILSA